jgi:glucosylceramidase
MHNLLHDYRHLMTTFAKVALVAGFVAGCSPAPSPSPTVTPGPTPETPIPVKVWLTSTDKSKLLEPQPDISFGPDVGGDSVIYVNENNQYQQMDGFGAAMTDSSAWLIYTQMPEAQRKAVMSNLFSRTDGIGISVMRLPMGASDLVNGPAYTYDDMPAGQSDPDLAHFSIEHDKAYIIPALQDAFKLNPSLKLIASPWSPPAWMKDSDQLGRGTLKSQYYAAWAQYFVRFIQAYQAEDVPIYAVTLQNEPHNEPGNYPGMRLEAADEATLVKNYLGPAFQAAGIDTKILIWDHNWNEPDYPISVLSDPAAKAAVDGSAFHCYAGTFLAQGIVHDAYPDKNLYETECSGGTWIPGFADGFKGDMADLVIGGTRYWAKAIIKWSIAMDTTNGPHTGGCGTCTGLITIDPNAASGFTYNYDYYSIGQASKFVLPDAFRIASSAFIYHGFASVAFRNPDGSKVLIVSNPDSYITTFVVRWGNRAFTYALAAQSAVTFTWDGTQVDQAPPDPPTAMTMKVNPDKTDLKWGFSPEADTYTVKRSDQPGGPYTVIASGIGVPEYFDTTVATGSTHYYVVSAVNRLGESPDSAEAKAAP